MCVRACVHAHMHTHKVQAHMSVGARGARRGIGSPGAGSLDGCELLDVDVRGWSSTRVAHALKC